MKNLFQDLRYGLRMLVKSPGFSAIAVLTLALGIGANTAIFSVIQRVLLRPLPYPQPESLVLISNSYPPAFSELGLSPGDYQDMKREARTVSEMASYFEIVQSFNLTGEGEPERVQASFAAADLFPMLGVRAVAGRTFFREEDKPGSAPVVLLSHQFWEKRFHSDPTVVGRTLNLDGQRFTLAGVLPTHFQLLQSVDLWLPFSRVPDDLNEHVHHGFRTIARLKPGTTISQAQSEFTALFHEEEVSFPDSHKHWGIGVQRLEDPSAEKLRKTLFVLFGAVGLVLLIACANIANLLLARNSAREREIALRTALGASPWRLVRQLLTESVLLAFIGGALGLLLAGAGMKILGALAPAELAVVQDTGFNGAVLLFTLGVCFAAGIVCGLLPALQTRALNLNHVLKQGSKGSGAFGSRRVHSILVVSEIALALMPLIGAGLLLRSFQRLLDVDPGFHTDHILTMEVAQASIPPEQLLKLSTEQFTEIGKQDALRFDQIAGRIQGLPGVKSAGGISTLPFGSELREASRFVIEDQPIPDTGIRPVAQIRTISLGYFATAGIPLLRGRMFTQDDWPLQNIVINETMAQRYWPGADPLGKRVNFCSLDPKPCWTTIIGVVGNVHQFGLDGPPTLDAYFTGGWTQHLVLRTASDPLSLLAAVEDVIHKADPTLPVAHVLTMDNLLSGTFSPRRFAAVLIGIFAGLALLLAAVGIYGVMSYTVGQRTQEIGVRMALGAQPRNVLRLILGRGTRLAIAGIAVGLVGALALSRLLATLLFGVRPTDPITFTAVAALLLLVALAACTIPARRAMRVDPMVALRYE
jgi:putative ABC transport system permease protein